MISLQAYFSGFSSKSDGSYALRFNTQELTPQYAADFAKAHNSFGHLVFKEGEIRESEIPKEPALDENQKSDSARARACLFILWKQLGSQGSYDDFKHREYDKWITSIKDKLE